MTDVPNPPRRSPRAVIIERQARVTRIVVGTMIVSALGAAGWGVTWLRKQRELRETDAGAAPASRPADTRPAPETRPATTRPASSPVYRADQTIARIRAEHPGDTVDAAWKVAQALRAEAGRWGGERAPQTEINRLLAAAFDTEKWILDRTPSFPELRRLRGEVRWPEALDNFDEFGMRFLTKAEAARLALCIKELDRIADQNQGWVKSAEYEAVAAPLVRKARAAHSRFDALLETAVGRAARAVEIRDLAALRDVLPSTRFRPFYHLPYVILVEQDDAWEEEEPAGRIARVLLGLRKSFFDAYGEACGLVPQNQRPVPVVLFTSRDAYHRYRAARKMPDVVGVEAHFEPRTSRLVLHADCARSALLHEGTHQLIDANTRMPLATYTQSFWFHEGIAEWFAGCRELPDGPDGLPRYEPGALMPSDLEPGQFLGPLAILQGTPPGARIPLKQLDAMLVRARDRLETEGAAGAAKIHLVYAQGWFLIYFLDHFAVGEDGVVQAGKPGRYRDLWLRYLRREIEGESGILPLLEAAKIDPKALEAEMNAYLAFVIRKVAKGHVRDGQLVPWTEVPGATADDDRLRR